MSDFITQSIAEIHLLNHPFYQAWMRGELSSDCLRDYATQYYHHVDAFPRYLSAIHSNCESASERKLLLANLNDEEGVGYEKSHPELWLDFAEGLGVSRETVSRSLPRPEIQNVIEVFSHAARSQYHLGLGALYAYESQIPEIAESKIRGLEKYQITSPKALAFFEVHQKADIEHRAIISGILENLPTDQKAEAVASAHHAAQALWNFLSSVYDKETCHA